MDDRDDEGQTAAERAFDALRAEVAGMRQAMKSLPDVITKSRPTVDYTETLGAIAKKLEIVGHFMAAIEQHPAIRTTPTQYNQAIAAAGERLITKSVRELEGAMAAAVTERRELAAMIGTMRGQWKQWEWLGWTGIAALFFGATDLAGVCTRVAFWVGWSRGGVHHACRSLGRGNRVDAGTPSRGLARP